MLTEFVTCGDCECVSCLSNHSCPKTSCIENPCIACDGIPPYGQEKEGPIADEDTLHKFCCDAKRPSIRRLNTENEH